MATIKIKFRTSSVKTKEGVLFYQIIHARVTRQINTGYKIFPSEWDKHLACIILPDNNDIRRRFLAQLTSQIAEDMHRLKNIISKLEHSGNPFTSGKIIELFRIPPINKYSFLNKSAKNALPSLMPQHTTVSSVLWTIMVTFYLKM